MFGKFFEAIKSLFSTIFGGSSRPKVKPRPDPAIFEPPQDGSEIKLDTIVIIADEMENVIIDPNEPDEEFDEDLFKDLGEPVPDIAKPEPRDEEPPEEPLGEEPVEDQGTTHKARFLWCLDNGHGKFTKGKRSPVFDDGQSQLFEYEFNRDIVRRIIASLEEKKVKFFNVVPEVEVDDFLEERVRRANSKKSDLPKIFVSIHSNASPARSINDWGLDSVDGIETWYFHNSKKGRKVAGIFQKHLIEKTGWKNRHLKSRPERQFYVLRKTIMTAVLTENGFYNNKAQAAELVKDAVRQKIADAHVAAIMEIEENGI